MRTHLKVPTVNSCLFLINIFTRIPHWDSGPYLRLNLIKFSISDILFLSLFIIFIQFKDIFLAVCVNFPQKLLSNNYTQLIGGFSLILFLTNQFTYAK